ncbi:MAG TPA: hypothetical protein PLB89_05525 [Flavobacteriales bacterium]|nr:hypothetical protein [Flavobacteriales bacterium]
MTAKLLSIAVLALLMSSCGGGTDPETTNDKAPDLVIGGEGTDEAVASLYQMPTPNELFSLIRNMGVDGEKRQLNPVSNADKYASLRGRAVNFGVYATDLVYASYYKLNVEVARYYLTTKKLADGLGIAAAFADGDFVRLEANLTRGDSLEMISNDVYAKAYAKLQDDQMGPVLCMVLAGGWVESMHLLLSQTAGAGKHEALVERVAEQKVTLEHLIEMMAAHEADPGVAELLTELMVIRDVYDQVNVKRVAHQGTSASGRMVLGDDVQIELTEEKFQALVAAVDELRARMIAPEDKTNA